MNATVREWVDKAEGDYATAQRELSTTQGMNCDAICFHAQQCIEKLMKGLLIQLGVMPPKIHNLMRLDKLLEPVCPAWHASTDDLDVLTRAGGAFRYPGATADSGDVAEVMRFCIRLREQLLTLLQAAGEESAGE